MSQTISKSRFKPRALEHFRRIQEDGQELIITDHNKPVLKIIPYREQPSAVLRELRNTVRCYEQPLEPVGENDWEALK
ncbi:type II toxin-antitoxin system Phd/YefM family antitoxin [Desulfurivibrio dismutans]|uniref:type II toxin-antitoxin system Phd/YefM family antitoxin n=1 Tax=Desulfurivibrio dismutans TaxID=1398908 RepID=UPI0023DC4F49|nr:type II toxin-antitoxin system prevent-host-death family antitoxin [Desulfurivibrio alkaliphilus]MDF1614365.1 type II toxin-antitoxin system prevent-host-death family antitoxin [Desulfurivibrio alkaliphilus]